MLILSRKRGERLMIGDDIVIEVIDIRGENCRIGVDAPLEMRVYRQEVYEAIQRERRNETDLE